MPLKYEGWLNIAVNAQLNLSVRKYYIFGHVTPKNSFLDRLWCVLVYFLLFQSIV